MSWVKITEKLIQRMDLLEFFDESGALVDLDVVKNYRNYDQERAEGFVTEMVSFLDGWAAKLLSLGVTKNRNTELALDPPVHLFKWNRVVLDRQNRVTRIIYADFPTGLRLPES